MLATTTPGSQTSATDEPIHGSKPHGGKHGDGLAAHCYVLLYRSGSMESMQSAVVEGFDSFVREQGAKAGAMRLTLAQFDSTDPFELVIDGVDIHKGGSARLPNMITQWLGPRLTELTVVSERLCAAVPALDFKPRNTTPLYDAMARMISHVERLSSDRTDEDVTLVVFTDGGENASREVSSAKVFGLVGQKKKLGWTFVFLGANQDSYTGGDRSEL